MAQRYGVAGDGAAYAKRVTVYIGKDGKILDVDREVNPRTAGADIAKRLAALGVPKR